MPLLEAVGDALVGAIPNDALIYVRTAGGAHKRAKGYQIRGDIYDALHIPIGTNVNFYTADSGAGRVVGYRVRRKMTISQILWGCGVAITGSDTNYWTLHALKITNTGGAGVGTALCSTPKTTKVTGGLGTTVPHQLYDMGADQNLDVDVGDLIYMWMVATLAPTALISCAHGLTIVGVTRE